MTTQNRPGGTMANPISPQGPISQEEQFCQLQAKIVELSAALKMAHSALEDAYDTIYQLWAVQRKINLVDFRAATDSIIEALHSYD